MVLTPGLPCNCSKTVVKAQQDWSPKVAMLLLLEKAQLEFSGEVLTSSLSTSLELLTAAASF